MYLTIYAKFKQAVSRESSRSGRTFVRLEFEAVGQPDFPLLMSHYAIDNEVGVQFLDEACKALDLDVPTRCDIDSIVDLLNTQVDPFLTVVVHCRTGSYDGIDYIIVRSVRKVPVNVHG